MPDRKSVCCDEPGCKAPAVIIISTRTVCGQHGLKLLAKMKAAARAGAQPVTPAEKKLESFLRPEEWVKFFHGPFEYLN